jgi:hypothetical protein
MSTGNTAGITRGGRAPGGGPTPFPPGGPLQFSGFATPSTIADSATEDLFTQFTMPGGTVRQLGTLIRIQAGFIFSTTGTPAFNLKAYIGGLLGLQVFNRGTAATENNCANVALVAQILLAYDSGAVTAAVLRYPGSFLIIGSKSAITTDAQAVLPQVTAPTGNVDLTAPLTVGFSFQWSAADPANTVTQETMTVEVMAPALAG